MKNYIFLLLLIIFSGCTNRYIIVKSLHPSNIIETPINNIFVEKFANDDIKQTLYIKDELLNAKIDNQKVFNLKSSNKNIDALILGEVLESYFNSKLYYEDNSYSFKCIRYKTIGKDKEPVCIEYAKRYIPCQEKTYRVKTQVKIFDVKKEILFSKIYTKSKKESECYSNTMYNSLLFENRNYYEKEKERVNTILAKEISKELIEDISPHYNFDRILFIDKIDDKYSINTKTEFKHIVELLNKSNIKEAKKRLEKLNKEENSKSFEILYNLALTYEYENMLKEARNYYFKANENCKDIESLEIINSAINRVNKNIINREKAKSQLDNIAP